MGIASENRAMATEYHRVAGTCRSPESPEQRPVPPGKAWWGVMKWDKALADFKKPWPEALPDSRVSELPGQSLLE
jgi:hypothetical protein